jgi:DNA-binding MarR family transcriptional regulator
MAASDRSAISASEGETGTQARPRAGADLDLEAFLPYRLSVVAHRVSRALSRVYAGRHGLSIPEWRVVANLGRAGALGAGELAELSSLDKPKVTRAIQGLELKGLIVRETPSADRRRATLVLTQDGRKVFRSVSKAAMAWQEHLLAPLGARQRTQLLTLLETIEARASTLEKTS